VLERLGIEYKGLYLDVDCSFPNHEANPIKEETLKDLKEAVKREGALLGIAFDGDGDRLGVVDENGSVVPGDFLIALIAKNILRKGGAKILYDLRSSKVVPEVIREMGGIPVKSRVGHSFISRKMKEEDIEFGGELSGHFYFKKTFYVESSILALINLLELISRENAKLSELVKPLKRYYKSGEVNFEVRDKEGKLKEIEEIYRERGAKIEKIDGVTVEFEDWWFNLRPSNTEDLLRLNLEAKTRELMEEKLKEVEEIIRG
ncbi:MAG TPA: phosphomannomutase/phosphoglucomutase, partial [Candidatus Aenigmarchaeota archaeon]|nr:phosphomannomutase/phosphoglucomutase [Candidatus Aenigmarchaeota archaeon]